MQANKGDGKTPMPTTNTKSQYDDLPLFVRELVESKTALEAVDLDSTKDTAPKKETRLQKAERLAEFLNKIQGEAFYQVSISISIGRGSAPINLDASSIKGIPANIASVFAEEGVKMSKKMFPSLSQTSSRLNSMKSRLYSDLCFRLPGSDLNIISADNAEAFESGFQAIHLELQAQKEKIAEKYETEKKDFLLSIGRIAYEGCAKSDLNDEEVQAWTTKLIKYYAATFPTLERIYQNLDVSLSIVEMPSLADALNRDASLREVNARRERATAVQRLTQEYEQKIRAEFAEGIKQAKTEVFKTIAESLDRLDDFVTSGMDKSSRYKIDATLTYLAKLRGAFENGSDLEDLLSSVSAITQESIVCEDSSDMQTKIAQLRERLKAQIDTVQYGHSRTASRLSYLEV